MLEDVDYNLVKVRNGFDKAVESGELLLSAVNTYKAYDKKMKMKKIAPKGSLIKSRINELMLRGANMELSVAQMNKERVLLSSKTE